jgi:hypothetical protein
VSEEHVDTRRQTRQMLGSLIVAALIVVLTIVVVTARLGPTPIAKLDAIEDARDAREDRLDDRLDARQDRLEEQAENGG